MQATQTRHLIDTRSAVALVLGAAIFAAGVLLGSAVDVGAPAIAAPAVTGDHRYDAIEQIRLDRGLPLVVGDRRHDAIEEIRATR
jgi:hypothetical protein